MSRRYMQALVILTVALVVLGVGASAMAATMGLTYGWAYPTHYNQFAPNGVPGGGLINEPMAYKIRVTGGYVPRLGTSWEENGSTLTVQLREGVVWHDGAKFTATDVVNTFLYGRALSWAVWDNLVDVTAVDDYTVKFEFEGRTSLPKDIVLQQVLTQFIYPSHVYGKAVDAQYVEALKQGTPDAETIREISEQLIGYRPERYVGTGPFTVEAVTQARISYKKNPSYYLADNVNVDDIAAYQGMDNQVAWQVRLSGRSDYDWAFSPMTVTQQWERRSGAHMNLPWDFAVYALYFNGEKLPQKVRQAMAYAIDRVELTEINDPFNVPTEIPTALLPTTVDEWLSEDFLATLDPYAYNPEKAKQLLKEAGYQETANGWLTPEGKPFELQIAAPAGWNSWVTSAETIVSHLDKIGVKATATAVGQPGFWQQQANGEFDMSIGWLGFWQTDPYMQFRGVFIQNSTIENAPPEQYARFDTVVTIDGEEVDLKELVQEAATNDLEAKKAVVEKLTKAYNEHLPILDLNAKRLQVFYSTQRFTGWPDSDHPLWQNAGGNALELLATFITEGYLQAK